MMKTLGHFKYHIYEVKLESSDDEREYKVTCIARSFQDIRSGKEEEVAINPFSDLRPARDAFQHAVLYCIGSTSFTDVSLFMQQC